MGNSESCEAARIKPIASSSLTIDREYLTRYPLVNYDHLYKSIAPFVLHLTVCRVAEPDLKHFLPYFKNVQHLHLQKMELMDELDLKDGFPNLLSVKLTECAFNVRDSPVSVNPTVALHLNKSTAGLYTEVLPWNNFTLPIPENNYARAAPFGLSRHLTLERMSCIDTDDAVLIEDIESLRIVSCHESVTISELVIVVPRVQYRFKSLCLETLPSVLDFLDNASHTFCADSLETLTLSHLPTPLDWLRGLKKLKQLRITLPIEMYQQVALTKAIADMENQIDAKYVCPFPAPEIDRNINILDKCILRKILRHLSTEDIFNLALTSSTFNNLVASTENSSTFVIDKKFLSRHPLKDNSIGYKALLRSSSSLELKCSTDELIELLQYAPNLQFLDLKEISGAWSKNCIDALPMVSTLRLPEHGRIPGWIITGMVRKLIPTLERFDAPKWTEDFKFMDHLCHLRKLQVNLKVLNEDLREFWIRNKKLECLYFKGTDNEGKSNRNVANQKKNWKVIFKLDNLTNLDIYEKIEYTGTISRFKKLEVLLLHHTNTRTTEEFIRAAGSHLKNLTVWFYVNRPDNLPLISGCENLNHLEFEVATLSQIIAWMNHFPKLDHIETFEPEGLGYKFEEELQQFLWEQNRV